MLCHWQLTCRYLIYMPLFDLHAVIWLIYVFMAVYGFFIRVMVDTQLFRAQYLLSHWLLVFRHHQPCNWMSVIICYLGHWNAYSTDFISIEFPVFIYIVFSVVLIVCLVADFDCPMWKFSLHNTMLSIESKFILASCCLLIYELLSISHKSWKICSMLFSLISCHFIFYFAFISIGVQFLWLHITFKRRITFKRIGFYCYLLFLSLFLLSCRFFPLGLLIELVSYGRHESQSIVCCNHHFMRSSLQVISLHVIVISCDYYMWSSFHVIITCDRHFMWLLHMIGHFMWASFHVIGHFMWASFHVIVTSCELHFMWASFHVIVTSCELHFMWASFHVIVTSCDYHYRDYHRYYLQCNHKTQ